MTLARLLLEVSCQLGSEAGLRESFELCAAAVKRHKRSGSADEREAARAAQVRRRQR